MKTVEVVHTIRYTVASFDTAAPTDDVRNNPINRSLNQYRPVYLRTWAIIDMSLTEQIRLMPGCILVPIITALVFGISRIVCNGITVHGRAVAAASSASGSGPTLSSFAEKWSCRNDGRVKSDTICLYISMDVNVEQPKQQAFPCVCTGAIGMLQSSSTDVSVVYMIVGYVADVSTSFDYYEILCIVHRISDHCIWSSGGGKRKRAHIRLLRGRVVSHE